MLAERSRRTAQLLLPRWGRRLPHAPSSCTCTCEARGPGSSTCMPLFRAALLPLRPLTAPLTTPPLRPLDLWLWR